MRFSLTAALALLLSVAALAQSSGTYQGTSWNISNDHTLVWGGQPYIPTGIRIHASADSVAAAKKTGFQDVIADLPPSGMGWKEAFSALDAAGMRYILSIDSLLPLAKGFAIEPEAYRIEGITEDRHVEFPLPGATRAMVLLVGQQDGEVESYQSVPIKDNKFSFDVKSKSDLDQLLLIYPEQTEASHPDYWDGFDNQRDTLLAALKNDPPGKGLRGILNPVGRMFGSNTWAGRFVPESAYFRIELKAYLQNKYRDVATTLRAWGVGTNDLDSFDQVCRLVPLWSGTRGVGQLWDTGTDRVYACEQKRSLIWSDIDTVVASAALERYQNLVPAIQQVADVPVLQDWTGWIPPFEAAKPILSGIGFSDSGRDLINDASRPASSLDRWSGPGWLLCTNLNLDSDGSFSPDAAFGALADIGVRGWFVSPGKSEVLAAALSAGGRYANGVATVLDAGPPLFFPDNAFNPVMPEHLPGGRWLLPSPMDGNRIDFGAGFYGYRCFQDGAYTTVLWADATQTALLHLSNPAKAKFTYADGGLAKVKAAKNGVQVEVGAMPLLVTGTDDLPVPDPCLVDIVFRMDQLLAYGEKNRVDVTEATYYFKDAEAKLDTDPGATFLAMKQQEWALSRRMAPYVWIEAEQCRDTNFSEMSAMSGCSNNAALLLHTPVCTDPAGFHATYSFSAKADKDYDIWIAAHIPSEERQYLYVQIDGQKLQITGDAESPYSAGFAWYHCGAAHLTQGQHSLTVRVLSPEGAYLALDAIVAYPGSFSPKGVTLPDAIEFVRPEKKKRKR